MSRIATDVGGTFTDLVCLSTDTGELTVAKVSTTPGRFADGVAAVLEKGAVDVPAASFFAHGSTVVINAITERRGAVTALVTTRGFRDVLAIGRGNRPDMYNLRPVKPTPFVPRSRRFEVTERIDHRGEVLEALEVSELDAIAQICQELSVEAIAVCLINAYANPDHEQQIGAHLAAALEGVEITLSSDVTRQMREYERTSTAVLNAYVQPVVNRYLGSLEQRLFESAGMTCAPVAMQSNGGTSTFARARRAPINLVESGPAAGVIGAARIGELLGEPNIIYLDIGGTTAKCSLIEHGRPKTTNEYRLEWTPTNAGYPVLVPVVDIVEIGAGGGSIAWIDDTGALHIGPQSAGADPGPACYGLGGTQPTVTDAKLIAGVLNADYFLGGQIKVDVQSAVAALERLGSRLGLTARQTANGIIRLANANMINALKLVSVRRGYDPREFTLVACGGGGAMHAAALGSELQVKRIVIPPMPGVFSAWGMLATKPRVDVVRTHLLRTASAAIGDVERIFWELEQEAATRFDAAEVSSGGVAMERAIELRYVGQEHTVHVPLDGAFTQMEALEQVFHAAHDRAYTFSLPDTAVEIVTFHVAAHRTVPMPEVVPSSAGDAALGRKGERQVDFDEDGVHACAVLERALLPAGHRVQGPAVVEELTSTTVIRPGQVVEVDPYGNLVISRER